MLPLASPQLLMLQLEVLQQHVVQRMEQRQPSALEVLARIHILGGQLVAVRQLQQV